MLSSTSFHGNVSGSGNPPAKDITSFLDMTLSMSRIADISTSKHLLER